MPAVRLGSATPQTEIAELLYEANRSYIVSVIATNISSVRQYFTIYLVPQGEELNEDKWVYLALDSKINKFNSYESIRFAVNLGDKVFVRTYFSNGISFTMNGVFDSFGRSMIFYSVAPPQTPNIGDIWIDNSTNIVYFWSGTQWLPAGPAGPIATDLNVLGSVNAVDDLPESNNQLKDTYVVLEENEIYTWTGVSWQNLGPIQGPQGVQGPQGIQGEKGETGDPAPQNFRQTIDAIEAGLTVDQFSYPAITKLDLTNNGNDSYRFSNQYGLTENPTIYAISGTTISFDLDVNGHPFLIKDSEGQDYSDGLIHVDSNGQKSFGSNAQAKTDGTLYWQIPQNAAGTYQYSCITHAGQTGTIIVKNISSI
jgi:plastocyanin